MMKEKQESKNMEHANERVAERARQTLERLQQEGHVFTYAISEYEVVLYVKDSNGKDAERHFVLQSKVPIGSWENCRGLEKVLRAAIIFPDKSFQEVFSSPEMEKQLES